MFTNYNHAPLKVQTTHRKKQNKTLQSVRLALTNTSLQPISINQSQQKLNIKREQNEVV